MAKTSSVIINTVISVTLACGAAFAHAAPASAENKARLERALQGGPAAKIAAETYSKPMNDASLESAKQQLLQLPRNQIREASSTFHNLNLGERGQMRQIGTMMLRGASHDEIKKSIDAIMSPELRAGLIEIQGRVELGNKGSDKNAASKAVQDGIKKLDDAARSREDSFKIVVDDAAKQKLAFESQQRRSGKNME